MHRLVTAALLLFTATAAITPALLHSGSAGPAPVAVPVTHQAHAPSQRAETSPSAEASAGRHRAEKIYVVQPPVGRYHESLWEIAQNHLGNGRRYPEIYELNKDHVQPDGSKLTIASLIRPGWVLHMPHDARGPGIETVTPAAARAMERGGAPGGRAPRARQAGREAGPPAEPVAVPAGRPGHVSGLRPSGRAGRGSQPACRA